MYQAFVEEAKPEREIANILNGHGITMAIFPAIVQGPTFPP
jgi:hypothetical protein